MTESEKQNPHLAIQCERESPEKRIRYQRRRKDKKSLARQKRRGMFRVSGNKAVFYLRMVVVHLRIVVVLHQLVDECIGFEFEKDSFWFWLSCQKFEFGFEFVVKWCLLNRFPSEGGLSTCSPYQDRMASAQAVP